MTSLSDRLQSPAAKWTLIGVASVGLATIGAATYIFYRNEQSKRRQRADKKKAIAEPTVSSTPAAAAAGGAGAEKEKKTKKKAAKKPARKTPADVPRDEEFLAYLEDIQQTVEGKAGHGINTPEVKKAVEWIQKIVPEEYSNQSRASAAKFIMAYYNIQVISALQNGDQSTFTKMQKQLLADQGLVWNLLDFNDANSPPEVEVDPILHILRLEISQRYQPQKNLTRAFDAALKFATQDQQGMLNTQLFMAAPILARYGDFMKVARLAFPAGEFDEKLAEFHEAVLQTMAPVSSQQTNQPVFDCQVLWNMCQENKEMVSRKPVTDLKWETYTIVAVKMVLKNAEHSGGEEKEEGIRNDAKNQPNDWVAIPGGHSLRRWGAVAEMLSISPLTLPMHGPMHDESLFLQQYIDMPEDKPDPVRQSEEYRLKFVRTEQMPVIKPPRSGDDSDAKQLLSGVSSTIEASQPIAHLWQGTYVMTQTPLRSSTRPRVSLTYEMSLYIEATPKPSPVLTGNLLPED